ncbi:LppU/SCO3897 family protein [Actinokineospora inagensis]|uniref:LppU/SCO3897 family protein n=1 Tax=Actinokineospora inagensis TaxID=103730 RepID=UPI0006891B82|nr:hypothetical protein [Actinokineospora inagensis]
MSNPQQPGQFGPPQGQPFPQGPGTPPGGQPYPQQGPGTPPGGQQFPPPPGQAPPPPFGQPPVGYPAAPPQVAPAKRGGGKKVLRIVLILIVLLVVGGGAVYYFTKSPATASVGDCIKINKASATNADVEKIDCGDPAALYKVGKKLDSSSSSCPSDSDFTEFQQTGSNGYVLCLAYNVKKGDCVANYKDDEKARKVTCGGSGSDLEVVDVIDGKADREGCADNVPLVYNEPTKFTLCLKVDA